MNIGSVWRYVKHTLKQYSLDNCAQLAASISYYVLFSIVPLTFVMVSVFGLVIRSEDFRAQVVEEVVDTINLDPGQVRLNLDDAELRQRFTPAQIDEIRAAVSALTPEEREAIADQLQNQGRVTLAGHVLTDEELTVRLQNSVSETLSNVAEASAPLTVFSLIASAWAASAMFGAVRKSLNIVWRVEYHRPYLQQKFWDLLMVMAFGALLLLSVVGTGVLRTLRELSDEALGPLSTGTGVIWTVVPYVLPGVVSFVVFAVLYRVVPAANVRWRDVWLGALVAAVLFEVLKNGFAFYVTHFRSYDLLYGSLGGILLFLTAVFFASSILLLGAELAHSMPGLTAGAFAAVPSDKPKMSLLETLRQEAVKFLRGLVLAPPREDGAEARRRSSDQMGR